MNKIFQLKLLILKKDKKHLVQSAYSPNQANKLLKIVIKRVFEVRGRLNATGF